MSDVIRPLRQIREVVLKRTWNPVEDSTVSMLSYEDGEKSIKESIVRKPQYEDGEKLIKESIFRMPGREHGKISYTELVQATNGFSTDNLIGVGSFSAVYKGTMIHDSTSEVFRFAVKVVNLQQPGAAKSFMTECDILRNMVHRNIVRIYKTFSSVDSMGNDFKAIVFEFMANGSLDNWLHPIANYQYELDEQYEPQNLDLLRRINIVIDVASALDYLHHNGKRHVIHCDINPGNILLDDDMTAHLGDFGLARDAVETLIWSLRTVSSVGSRGTIGYVAPEYGTENRASTKGDVYSYGILLLEMFTGKRPCHDIFRTNMNLKKYVEMAIPGQVADVIDVRLRSWGMEANDEYDAVTLECVSSLLRIGLSCSSELPVCRPDMREILKPLYEIRDMFLKKTLYPVER